jgi:hypothetical protein
LDRFADDGKPGSIGRAWAIAILFAAVAVTSFAVDQSVTLSVPPHDPPASSAGR